MLTKQDVAKVFHQMPDEYFDSLERVSGYIIQRGRSTEDDTEFTALWSEDAGDEEPLFFWNHNMAHAFLIIFLEGVKEAEARAQQEIKEAYSRGRQAGISLVQNGFTMVFGAAGRSYVQQIVNEMGRDNVQ